MIHFLTFTDKKYFSTRKRIIKEAEESGFFDKIWEADESWLSYDILKYCNENSRGFGYWVWKSIIFDIVFSKIEENDILIYLDAGCTIYKEGEERFDEYIKMVNESDCGNISLSCADQSTGINYLEKMWTKNDIFVHFNAENLKDTPHLLSGILIFRKCDVTKKIFKIFKDASINYKNLIDDSPSITKNDVFFVENRHDQSLLSIIRKQNGTIILEHESNMLDKEFLRTNIYVYNKKYPFAETRLKY